MDPLGTLYALKTGVVPGGGGLAEITVGRDAVLERVRSRLGGMTPGGPAHLDFIQGDYGEGKSHLLEVARQEALHSGFAVSKVAVNFDSMLLYRPKLLLRSITRSLELPQRAGRGLEGLLRNLVEAKGFPDRARDLFEKSRAMGDWHPTYSIWPAGLYAAASSRTALPVVSRWLTGDEVPISHVRPWVATVCQPPRYMAISVNGVPGILSGLAHSLHELGFGGLVLLVDEMENGLSHSSTLRQRQVTSTALGSLLSRPSPLYVLGAVTASVHLALRMDLPYSYGDWRSSLQLILRRFNSDQLLRVQELSREDLLRVGSSVTAMHEAAFDRTSTFASNGALTQLVDHVTTHSLPIRSFLRTLVDLLDLDEQKVSHRTRAAARIV